MMSVPVDADLLNAANWTFSSEVAGNSTWLNNQFGGWLEGNAVAGRDGQMFDLLRVDTPGYPEKVAMITISTNGATATLIPTPGSSIFPAVRKNSPSATTRSAINTGRWPHWVQPSDQSGVAPGSVRNNLALTSSTDLTNWTMRCVVLYHPDQVYQGSNTWTGSSMATISLPSCAWLTMTAWAARTVITIPT